MWRSSAVITSFEVTASTQIMQTLTESYVAPQETGEENLRQLNEMYEAMWGSRVPTLRKHASKFHNLVLDYLVAQMALLILTLKFGVLAVSRGTGPIALL